LGVPVQSRRGDRGGGVWLDADRRRHDLRRRTAGATAQLVRILGAHPAGIDDATTLLNRANEHLRPEGRPLYAGLVSLGLPGNPMGDLWPLADRLREYRGDAHTAVWTSAGFDATEIGLVTEQYWGLPPRTDVRTRAWSDADLDATEARLLERGLVDGGGLTAAGRTAREDVEFATDRQCRPIIESLGGDLETLIAPLASWGTATRAAGGYLPSGPTIWPVRPRHSRLRPRPKRYRTQHHELRDAPAMSIRLRVEPAPSRLW